jgi:hypothetical protein
MRPRRVQHAVVASGLRARRTPPRASGKPEGYVPETVAAKPPGLTEQQKALLARRKGSAGILPANSGLTVERGSAGILPATRLWPFLDSD